MAYYSDHKFTTFQGRATPRDAGLRLPIVTLVLGLLAAVAIAAGALNWLPVPAQPSGELTNIEFLTGVYPHAE